MQSNEKISNISSDFVLNFKLDTFDGPLDLLVELIREKKMDILTLDISELTYQYLEFVNNNLIKLPIDDISEYLVMASYLTELKSKMILPLLNPETKYDETELEIDRLRRQLFLYKQYKDSINQFKFLQSQRVQYIAKECDNLEEYAPDSIPEAPLPEHVPLEKLVRAWQKVLFNTQAKIEDKEFIIHVSNVNLEEIEQELTQFVSNENFKETNLIDFFSLFDSKQNDLEYLCAVFLSILVLCRNGFIKIRQNENGDIFISKNYEQLTEAIHHDVNEAIESNKEIANVLKNELNKKTEISRENTKQKAKRVTEDNKEDHDE